MPVCVAVMCVQVVRVCVAVMCVQVVRVCVAVVCESCTRLWHPCIFWRVVS